MEFNILFYYYYFIFIREPEFSAIFSDPLASWKLMDLLYSFSFLLTLVHLVNPFNNQLDLANQNHYYSYLFYAGFNSALILANVIFIFCLWLKVPSSQFFVVFHEATLLLSCFTKMSQNPYWCFLHYLHLQFLTPRNYTWSSSNPRTDISVLADGQILCSHDYIHIYYFNTTLHFYCSISFISPSPYWFNTIL